jgi:hypothetical protein
VYIDCNSNHCPVATGWVVQYQAEATIICNCTDTLVATVMIHWLQLIWKAKVIATLDIFSNATS